jgi:hypothetical protein
MSDIKISSLNPLCQPGFWLFPLIPKYLTQNLISFYDSIFPMKPFFRGDLTWYNKKRRHGLLKRKNQDKSAGNAGGLNCLLIYQI